MNVLKPSLKTTIKILLSKGISHREIASNTGINRRTIRRYARMFDLGAIEASSDDSKYPTPATGFDPWAIQNAPSWPPAFELKIPMIPSVATAKTIEVRIRTYLHRLLTLTALAACLERFGLSNLQLVYLLR